MSNKSKPAISKEDFLKAVLKLQPENGFVKTGQLAKELAISAPSVTDRCRRLDEDGLLDYEKYKGVRLTEKGRDEAVRVLRRHRLIEQFLYVKLGYKIDEIHDEAENMEHVVSDKFIAIIDAKLGYPKYDPHGAAIPNSDGEIPQRDLISLVNLPLNKKARIRRFFTSNSEMVKYIIERGFEMDSTVQVIEITPFHDPITVKVKGHKISIGYNLASHIMVEIIDSSK